MQGPQFLSVEQVLLTTLVVKLAVVAALATMLVRYRRFRHILIFERRAWPDRLIFALSLGIPLTAVVALFVLRRRVPDAPRPFRAWGYPVAPAIYAIASFAILVNGLYRGPSATGAGALIIAAGLPVYFLFKRQIPKPKSQNPNPNVV